jgi:NitT/TauT family transport system ATP-binding protein
VTADAAGDAVVSERQQPLLHAEGVSKVYTRARTGQELSALEEVSLSVETGQFVTIVGPSGCGKSTFLNMVDGLIAPTTGEIRVAGKTVVGPGHDRAMVFQDSSLLPWYTVLRNVSYGLECQGTPAREASRAAQRYVELVGLRGFEHHFPHELSGGMQQRVNLARALAVDPDLLLMDEPFAALDPQTREMMQGELLRIWNETRKTVLFITHAISEAIYLSDRVIVMSARPGRIIADIPVDIPRPRPLAAKRSEEVVAYERQIWSLLEQEVRTTMDRETLVGEAGG